MKNILPAVVMAALLILTPKAYAESVTVVEEHCTTSQYGGQVCGETTTTKVVSEQEEIVVVSTGIEDWELWQVIAVMFISAVAATYLYKKSYSWYILG